MTNIIVDEQDAELFASRRWHINNDGYATARIGGRRVLLHRLIAGARTRTEIVDHINGDKLNNSRSNLRIVTVAMNTQNRHAAPTSSSGFLGVSWNANCRKWQAQVKTNGRTHYLGLYTDVYEAAAVADSGRARLHPGYIKKTASAA